MMLLVMMGFMKLVLNILFQNFIPFAHVVRGIMVAFMWGAGGFQVFGALTRQVLIRV